MLTVGLAFLIAAYVLASGPTTVLHYAVLGLCESAASLSAYAVLTIGASMRLSLAFLTLTPAAAISRLDVWTAGGAGEGAVNPVTYALVALGGAIGAALGVFILRKPSPRRLLLSTAMACGLLGVLSAYPYAPVLTAPVTFGVLGSAASMVAVATAPPLWLDSQSILRSTLAVIQRLALYCAVGLTFALFGYLAVRAGTTLYVKLSQSHRP